MWDERYSEEGFAFGTEPNTFLAESADILPLGNCLCLAEGEGRNGVFLAGLGHCVTAMDQSEVGLKKAQALAAKRGLSITTVAKGYEDFPFGLEQWDSAISIFAHAPKDLRRMVHRSVVAGLKPGGVFLLEAYRPEQLETSGIGGPSGKIAHLLMRPDDIRKELEGLEILHFESLIRNVDEGQYHRGEAAVLQVIARKPKDPA